MGNPVSVLTAERTASTMHLRLVAASPGATLRSSAVWTDRSAGTRAVDSPSGRRLMPAVA